MTAKVAVASRGRGDSSKRTANLPLERTTFNATRLHVSLNTKLHIFNLI